MILLFRRIRKRHIPTLVVWKDRVKRPNELNYREEFVFLPDEDGEFNEIVIPIGASGDDGEEIARPFSIPETNMAETESWILRDTRGHGLRPSTLREPDAFVHKVTPIEEQPSTGHLLRIGRCAIAESVRQTDPTSFIYTGDGDFEAQFDAEVLSRADSNHPWTKLKKRDIQEIDERQRAELPKLRPVKVVKKEDRKDDVIYHGISLEYCEMAPVYKKNGYLPWWFIYISWTIAVLTILLCAFFTIFYGLYIGRLRSKHWRSEVFFSFIQTIVITQPIRIVIVATVFSLIDRVGQFTNFIKKI